MIPLPSLARLINRRPRWIAPAVEMLESRIAPANNVITSLVGGTLTITTVDQLGEAEILAGDNNQTFEIVGSVNGNVTINKTANTTIDGLATAAFTGVTNIVMQLKSGLDQVICKTLDLSGDLTFDGGDGASSFKVDALAGATKLRNLTMLNGDGLDNFQLVGASTTISGNVTIKHGSGSSNNVIGFNSTDDVTIQGALTFINGDGSDSVNFSGDDLQIGGAVTIRNGEGPSGVQFTCDNSILLAKALTIVNGSGTDSFVVAAPSKTTSFAGITITNGVGDTITSFASTVSDAINGNLIITNGAGNDTFVVNGPSFSVTGFVQITHGAGNSVTDISPTASNTVGGAFTLKSAAGGDITTISGATVTYGSVKLSHGAGDTTVNVSGGNLTLAGLSQTSTDGVDTLVINATATLKVTPGGITLKNGVGDSNTTISSTGSAAIQGTLAITNADGADMQIIGSGAGNFNGLHSVVISNGVGGANTLFNPAMLTITGSVSVTNREGGDSFRLGNGALTNFTVTGSVSVNCGAGNASFSLAPSSGGTISGALKFVGGAGNDLLDLFRATVTGKATFKVGSGNNGVEIDNSTLGALMIDSSTGNDLVTIEASSNDGLGSRLEGPVSVKLGAGEDAVVLGLDMNDFVTALKSLILDGGLSIDRLDQGAATNSFALAPRLLGFEVQAP